MFSFTGTKQNKTTKKKTNRFNNEFEMVGYKWYHKYTSHHPTISLYRLTEADALKSEIVASCNMRFV